MKNVVCFILLSAIFLSCKKDNVSPNTPVATLPTITTTSITSIAQTTALSGGNVSSDGGATVTVRGICWNTSANPGITGNHTTDGSGLGVFVSTMTGLIPTTIYYVRAYATNSAGTVYGNEINFTTSNSISIPTITTSSINSITQTTALSGGTISSDGGAPVTGRGVCWGLSPNPVFTGNHTTDGTGTGTFTSALTGLTASTIYYVRAYATNISGTTPWFVSPRTYLPPNTVIIIMYS